MIRAIRKRLHTEHLPAGTLILWMFYSCLVTWHTNESTVFLFIFFFLPHLHCEKVESCLNFCNFLIFFKVVCIQSQIMHLLKSIFWACQSSYANQRCVGHASNYSWVEASNTRCINCINSAFKSCQKDRIYELTALPHEPYYKVVITCGETRDFLWAPNFRVGNWKCQ